MERIGRYEVVERLGAGGFATVYRVRDPVLDSHVAVKVLADNWAGERELHDRFIREAQLLRRIDSERVVTVHDIGELPSGQPYFVMALIDRGTLDERLVRIPQPSTEEIVAIATQVAECVRTVHDHGMIHRDIKPSNLLIAGPRTAGVVAADVVLAADERLILGDFGLAKDVDLRTQVGMTIAAGTGGYAAPEQMTPNGAPNRQTDFYAATAVMYRVLNAATPPEFDIGGQRVPFPDGDPIMTGQLGQFFRRGMAFHPTERHTSVDEWLHDLNSAINSVSGAMPIAGVETIVGQPSSWAPPHQAPPAPSGVPAIPAGLEGPQHEGFRSVPSIQPGPGHSQPAQPHTPNSYPAQPHPGYGQPAVHSQPAPLSQPVLGYQAPQSQPAHGYQHADSEIHRPVTYESVRASRRGVGRWLSLVVVLAAIAAGAGYYLTRPAGPDIEGPDSVDAGESVTFSAELEGFDDYVWTDWNNEERPGSQFTVTGVVPGSLSFSVQAIGEGGQRSAATERTIEIDESDRAPTIIGPGRVRVGQAGEYTFESEEGTTNPRWRGNAGAEEPGSGYRIDATGAGRFPITLIVTLPDGTEIGTTRIIELYEPGS